VRSFGGCSPGSDRELAREIVQTTLCKAIAGLPSFRGESALATWLCSCCRNEIFAHFRRRGTAREVALDAEALDREVAATAQRDGVGLARELERREESELVHATLDALPPRYGRALEWKYLDGLPVQEIARRLELGPKAAESLLTRARQAFRTAWARLTAAPGTAARETDAGSVSEVMP
jgi:RNA polymerase sigma-70 factor (ECF subfamily)